ncbi:transposase [Planococcus antarcticus DSM 14505]|uniref:Transposase n=1 Tax=Planococcus antarcticus DSM 14505 TaxID=1185653 RepID=A0AA87LQ02_9BACL|nr:IS701-like element ISPlan1 family transposase [Planococcus antarcticus]EIM05186.1 transposase [Planococcus antarcticus DSM 14505]
MNRLSYQQEIDNGFADWNLGFYFSKPVLKHLVHFTDGILSIGFTGKLTEIHTASRNENHRTLLGHFLKQGVWNEQFLLGQTQQHILRKVAKDEPLFVLIDDTICKKTKPSSRAKSPIDACGFHYSHADGKSVWGHQGVEMMVKSAGRAFPFDFRLYTKETGESKIQLADDMIRQLPTLKQTAYVLFDTWYTASSLIKAARSKNLHVISALKSNRIIYPNGIRIQVKEFAASIQEVDTDLVTVGKATYRVYRYVGPLSDGTTGTVLLSWTPDQPMDPKLMRCFFSTDATLTSEQILRYYGERWSIETYFQTVKKQLGFAGYQIRNERAIRRYWTIVQFTYVFAMYLRDEVFQIAIRQLRRQKMGSLIEFVYEECQNGVALDHIKNELQPA